ncbi:hypothetical protein CMI38_00500 [Candidatus Pacearchaeota archaeon]|jgi:hypothetical protein|nr:hypothetical protein [Candidatus Pacearchaeota archaeon]|tara:strand:- start:4 stop:1104 length:1101 start_codon:yes stop_codon:yes gene_type:complete
MAIPNLTEILTDYECETRKVQDGIISTVINTGDIETMSAYGGFLSALDAYVSGNEDSGLAGKFNEVKKIFQYTSEETDNSGADPSESPTNYVEPGVKETTPNNGNAKEGGEWITQKEAYALWREKDGEAGREVLEENGSYYFRLTRSSGKDDIIVKGQKGDKLYNKDSLLEYIDAYEYRGADASKRSKGNTSKKKGMDSKSNEDSANLEIKVVDVSALKNSAMSEYGEFITPKESISLYREIETGIDGIDNSKTNDIAYRSRIYTMLSKGVKTNSEKGSSLRISRDDFIERIGARVNKKLGVGKPTNKKKKRKSSSAKKKKYKRYGEYEDLIKKGKSHDEVIGSLEIEKGESDTYRRAYARWGNRK